MRWRARHDWGYKSEEEKGAGTPLTDAEFITTTVLALRSVWTVIHIGELQDISLHIESSKYIGELQDNFTST